ncbi:hypothetical protein IW148_003979 [Coemansia sp. RSA 1199]|nr:hypothetical protein IW148_003979 [Coemansia sp. RSA 1199]
MSVNWVPRGLRRATAQFPVATRLALRNYSSGKDTAREFIEKAATPFEVFDRNAKRMQRSRAASRTQTSHEVDYLRDEVAARVADRLLDIKRRYHTVVELGAGCGHLAKAVDDDMMDKLIMCEMSPQALSRDADTQYDVEVERRVMDEEMPQFEDESLDAVVSSLSMHWVNDLPGMLIRVRKALVPDGVFIGAMLGGDSLFELRSSLQLADVERDGGIAARVSPLTSSRDVGNLLSRAGMTLSTVDLDDIVVNYPSMLHLISDINAMGEGNAVVQRLPFIKRDTLVAASAIYKELSNEDVSQKFSDGLKITPRKSRTSKSGAVCSYGMSESERDKDEEKYAKHLVKNYTHQDISELLDFAQPATTAGQDAAELETGFISNLMERILAGEKLPTKIGLNSRLLVQFAREIGKWTNGGSSRKFEKPLYKHFTNFALFVAQCLKSKAASKTSDIARLILPAERTDYKPDDSNDSRRIDVGLAVRGTDASVKCVSLGCYADMLCIAEAKKNRALDKDALAQLFMYSVNMYMRQPNRRYLWGLTICADEVYACLMLSDGFFVSPAMRISELAGRKMLISWLVRWSMCPEDRLGYDPTMHQVTAHSEADGGGSYNGKVDDRMYTIDCYDDKSQEITTYITKRTITSADDMLGRHTRCFVATRYSGSGTDSSATEVVIKDAWSPAKHPPLEDPRDEIRLLRKIHDTFEDDTPDHIYPNMLVGGHVRLDQKDMSTIDTTDAIFNAAGVDRIDPPCDPDTKSAWKNQPLRAHRRIVIRFCAQYKLLPRFAKALHKALFGNVNCPGAHLDDVDDEESSDDDDSDTGDKPTEGSNDPLVKRSAHVDAILADLEKVLDKFKSKALAVL